MISRLWLLLSISFVCILSVGPTSQLVAQTGQGEPAAFTPGEEATVLVGALAYDNDRIRNAAAERLVELGADAVPALREGLRHWNPHVYEASARILGKIGEEGLPVLIEGLTCRNVLVRVKAADAIRGMGKKSIPDLCDVLRRGTLTGRADPGDAGSRFAEGTVIVNRFAPYGDPWLQSAYEQADLRREAADVLGSIGADISDAVVATMDRDAAAAASLIEAAAPAIPPLAEALNDSHEPVRAAAGNALHNIGASAIPSVREVLARGNAPARETAAQVLGLIGQQVAAVAPTLGEATKDRDVRVRTAAVEALGTVSMPLVRTEVAAALGGEYRDAIIADTDAVAQVIPKDSAAVVKTLRESLTDPDRRVRFLAVLALNRIGEVVADAERRASGANVDDIVDGRAKKVVQEASKNDATMSEEAKKSLEATVRAGLREGMETVLSQAVEANRGVRAEVEQALRTAAEDPDLVVRVAASRALSRVAGQVSGPATTSDSRILP